MCFSYNVIKLISVSFHLRWSVCQFFDISFEAVAPYAEFLRDSRAVTSITQNLLNVYVQGSRRYDDLLQCHSNLFQIADKT